MPSRAVGMPELPEVETTRRSLVPALEGATIRRAEVGRDRMLRRQPRPLDFSDRMRNRRVEALGRRGKFLLGHLDGDLTMVLHLGMSGRMRIEPPGADRPPHTNVVLETADAEVWMIDPRTFGFVVCLTPDEWDGSPFAALGPDALEELPRSPQLGAAITRRRSPLKALLLDQHLIAGLGNIYADEVLHRARLHPLRIGASLDVEEVKRLRAAIRPVLEAGLRHGGTTLDDLAYLLPDGRAGEYAQRLRAYGRTGLPCRRCGTPIERIVVTQRSTHFCPTCQPPG